MDGVLIKGMGGKFHPNHFVLENYEAWTLTQTTNTTPTQTPGHTHQGVSVLHSLKSY